MKTIDEIRTVYFYHPLTYSLYHLEENGHFEWDVQEHIKQLSFFLESVESTKKILCTLKYSKVYTILYMLLLFYIMGKVGIFLESIEIPNLVLCKKFQRRFYKIMKLIMGLKSLKIFQPNLKSISSTGYCYPH